MTLKLTHIRLLVSDVPACMRFYRDVLRFDVLWDDGEGNYVSFKTGDVVLALNKKQSMATALGTTEKPASAECQDKVALILAVEDLDLVYQQLKAEDVQFITEPIDHPDWGIRTAHLRDPEGNLIEINCPLET